jgi:hypothetical protein
MTTFQILNTTEAAEATIQLSFRGPAFAVTDGEFTLTDEQYCEHEKYVLNAILHDRIRRVPAE